MTTLTAPTLDDLRALAARDPSGDGTGHAIDPDARLAAFRRIATYADLWTGARAEWHPTGCRIVFPQGDVVFTVNTFGGTWKDTFDRAGHRTDAQTLGVGASVLPL